MNPLTGSRGGVEPVDDDRYRVRFGKPIEAEVALMYFGFYPDVRLFWKDGRVVSVVAPSRIYEQILADFAGDDSDSPDASERINRAVLDDLE